MQLFTVATMLCRRETASYTCYSSFLREHAAGTSQDFSLLFTGHITSILHKDWVLKDEVE
eukprot:4183457-Pleurochrysis_carterae.AAC.2